MPKAILREEADYRLPADVAFPARLASVKERNGKRLRRIEGQVRGIQKMVEDDRYCADIMTQIASVHEALRGVGRELMRNHLRHCATTAIREGGERAEQTYDELLDLMYRSAR